MIRACGWFLALGVVVVLAQVLTVCAWMLGAIVGAL